MFEIKLYEKLLRSCHIFFAFNNRSSLHINPSVEYIIYYNYIFVIIRLSSNFFLKYSVSRINFSIRDGGKSFDTSLFFLLFSFPFCFLFKRIRMKERFAAKRANSQREAEFSLAIHREIHRTQITRGRV